MYEQRLITHTRIPVSVRNWIFKQNEQKSPSNGRRNSEVTGMSLCTILISGTNRNGLNVCLHCKLLMATIQFKFEHWKKKLQAKSSKMTAKDVYKIKIHEFGKFHLENICNLRNANGYSHSAHLDVIESDFQKQFQKLCKLSYIATNHLGNRKTTSLNCIWHFVCLLST